jgi:hypothetical protein
MSPFLKIPGLAIGLFCGIIATASATQLTSLLYVNSTNVGTITVTDQSGGGVIVTEQLAPDVFAFSGASNPFEFNLHGDPSLVDVSTAQTQGGKTYYAVPSVISGLSFTPSVSGFTPSFVFYQPPSAPQNTSMDYGLDCSNCNGTSQGYNGFSFNLANYTTQNFISSGGYYFISDVGICSGRTCNTSAAYASTITNNTIGGGNTEVPEPASLTVLGSAMLGTHFLARRKRRR